MKTKPKIWNDFIDCLYLKMYRNFISKRKPDFVVPFKKKLLYMERWYVIPRNKILNIYVHKFNTPDPDEVLHDHPWFNISIILKSFYVEHTIKHGGVNYFNVKRKGKIIFRSPWHCHRLDSVGNTSCVTLFITGPVIRKWGFHTQYKWVPFHVYTKGRVTNDKRINS